METSNVNNSYNKEYSLYRKFINQTLVSQKPKKEDVLANYPLRLLAYSNEVGSAISPISPTLGTALWAPALLYLGADIYDKYKNEDKTYNPSAKRAMSQTIFQGLASVILPSAAIKIGQKIGVKLSNKNSPLSASDKKELIEFTTGFVKYGNFPNKEKDYSKLTESLIETFKNQAKENQKRLSKRGILKKFASIFHESSSPDDAMIKFLKNENNPNNPVVKQLKKYGDMAAGILTNENNINQGKYSKYFEKIKASGADVELAKKNTVLKILKDNSIDKSKVATVAGFVTLFLLAQPIDYFVENILMEKIIDPFLDKVCSKEEKEKKLDIQPEENQKTISVNA